MENEKIIQIVLLILLIGTFFYYANTTNPIPKAEFNINVSTNYDTEEYIVPKYITNEMAVFGAVIAVALFFSSMIKGIKDVRITEREFKETISREIRKKQTIPLPDGRYELPKGRAIVNPNILLRYKTENKIKTAFQYVAQVMIANTNEKERYFIVTGSPFTKFIDDFVETDSALTIKDKCPECGRFFDMKFITPEEMKELKELRIFSQSPQ